MWIVAALSPIAVAQMGQGGGGGMHHHPGSGGTPATSAVFTNFGAPCGADLSGTVGANLAIGFDVTNAAADAFGMVFAGAQAATPWPLPFSTCTLLVEPQHLMFGRMFVTDANGAATISLTNGPPPANLTVSFQVVVMNHDPVTHARTLDASNGTELVTQ